MDNVACGFTVKIIDVRSNVFPMLVLASSFVFTHKIWRDSELTNILHQNIRRDFGNHADYRHPWGLKNVAHHPCICISVCHRIDCRNFYTRVTRWIYRRSLEKPLQDDEVFFSEESDNNITNNPEDSSTEYTRTAMQVEGDNCQS